MEISHIFFGNSKLKPIGSVEFFKSKEHSAPPIASIASSISIATQLLYLIGSI